MIGEQKRKGKRKKKEAQPSSPAPAIALHMSVIGYWIDDILICSRRVGVYRAVSYLHGSSSVHYHW